MSRKAWTFALNIAGVEKYAQKTYGCDQHWRPFDSSFNERSVFGPASHVCVYKCLCNAVAELKHSPVIIRSKRLLCLLSRFLSLTFPATPMQSCILL